MATDDIFMTIRPSVATAVVHISYKAFLSAVKLSVMFLLCQNSVICGPPCNGLCYAMVLSVSLSVPFRPISRKWK